MRLLLVGSKYPPEYAGAGLRLHRMLKRLQARDSALSWRVLCNSVEMPRSERYEFEGVAVTRIVAPIFSQATGSPRGVVDRIRLAGRAWIETLMTWQALAREAADLIHVFGTSASTAAAIWWAKRHGKPLVIELVTAGASPRQALPGFSRFGADVRHGTVIVAISPALDETCRGLGLERNVWVRPNPIDEDRFRPAFENRATLRRGFTPFAPEDRVLVSVAKLMPQKNQIFLLDVLEHLPASYKLVLAGPTVSGGPLLERDRRYLADLRARAESPALRGRVLLRTEFVDPAPLMQLADVYLMPNLEEGLGTPMLESMACGVPVVANRGVPAFRHWVRDGENGFACDLDAAQWAEAIDKAMALPRAQMIAVAEEVRRVASASRVDAGYRALYGALLAAAPDDELDAARIVSQACGAA